MTTDLSDIVAIASLLVAVGAIIWAGVVSKWSSEKSDKIDRAVERLEHLMHRFFGPMSQEYQAWMSSFRQLYFSRSGHAGSGDSTAHPAVAAPKAVEEGVQQHAKADRVIPEAPATEEIAPAGSAATEEDAAAARIVAILRRHGGTMTRKALLTEYVREVTGNTRPMTMDQITDMDVALYRLEKSYVLRTQGFSLDDNSTLKLTQPPPRSASGGA